MKELFDHVGISASALIAGLVGGLMSLSMLPQLTFRKAVAALIGGAACAAYLTPLAVEWLGLASRNLENGLAFALGIGGMRIIGGILKLWSKFEAAPEDVLNRWKK